MINIQVHDAVAFEWRVRTSPSDPHTLDIQLSDGSVQSITIFRARPVQQQETEDAA